MASNIQDATRDTMYRILPELLVADLELNGRAYEYTREECADLIADFADPAIGQLENLSCKKIQGSDKYRVIFGNRRRAAAIFLNQDLIAQGKEPIKLKFTTTTVGEKEAFHQNLRENFARKAPNPIDIAKIIRIKREVYGETDAQIAAGFPNPRDPGKGMSLAFVTQHALLNNLPEDIRQRVRNADFSADYSFKLAKLTEPEMRSTIADAAELEAGVVEQFEEEDGTREKPFANDSENAPVTDGVEEAPTEPVAEEPVKPRRKKPEPTEEQAATAQTLKTKGKISGPALEQAIRKNAPEKASSRKMAELCKDLEMLIDSAPLQHYSEPMVKLMKGILDYRAAKLSKRQLTTLFEKCCRAKFV